MPSRFAALRAAWVPLTVLIAGVIVSLLLAASLRDAEKERLSSAAIANSAGAAADLQDGMQGLLATFVRVARQHGYTMLRAEGTWRLDLTSLLGSAWLDPSGAVVAAHPAEQAGALSAFAAGDAARLALAVARDANEPVGTPSVISTDGGSRFHVVVPVSHEAEFRGYVVGSFAGDRLYGASLPKRRASDWAFGVFEGGRELYRTGAPVGDWYAEAPLTVLGVERQVRAGPTARIVTRLQSVVPAVVLAAGSLLALLLAASVAFAQASRRRAAEAEAAERALRASEEQYRLLFDGNPSPMWVYDEETLRFLAVNDQAVRSYGYSREEFLAMSIRDIRPPETVPLLEETVARRRRDRGAAPSLKVWKHLRKDGGILEVEITGRPLQMLGRPAWLVLASDVTERKRLEGQLLQSQKMESIGQLAGGVAHDFNNLLGVIIGYGELLQRDVARQQPAAARVDQILKAADRAAVLTRQLLAFSRKQVLDPTVLDLNTVVADVEKMLGRLIGEDVQLVTELDSGLDLVKADRGQLEQVILNLAVNARDAMPHGGKLILETAAAELDEAYAAARPDARAGRHVMLAVSDTGHGMDSATLAHMFEPFFTTKAVGKGTGLGLAMVHGIVRQSGGHVTVYSEVGRGTTFKIYLPIYEGEGAPAAKSAIAPARGGTETILVVEDEWSLRVMIGEILAGSGYTVTLAGTPEEALSVAHAQPGPIALIVTDVVLPGKSGREVADEVRTLRPEARVLFMSGYTDDAIGHQGVLEAGVNFLQKPFMTEQLLHKVRDVLDAPVPP